MTYRTSPEKTNWYVITGGPNSGKTSVINYLAYLSHTIRPEIARIIIDDELSKGKTIKEIRKDEIKFLNEITKLKIRSEECTPKEELVFWDRAIPDDIAYLRYYNADCSFQLEASKNRLYKGIFLLDMLPNYKADYARIETEETVQNIQEEIYKTYTELGYEVIQVPVISIEERVNKILQHVQKVGFWVKRK